MPQSSAYAKIAINPITAPLTFDRISTAPFTKQPDLTNATVGSIRIDVTSVKRLAKCEAQFAGRGYS